LLFSSVIFILLLDLMLLTLNHEERDYQYSMLSDEIIINIVLAL